VSHSDFYYIYKRSIHSEKNVIMSIKNKSLLASSKIVIVRLSDGQIIPAKPCVMCQNLLDKYKLCKICILNENKIVKS